MILPKFWSIIIQYFTYFCLQVLWMNNVKKLLNEHINSALNIHGLEKNHIIYCSKWSISIFLVIIVWKLKEIILLNMRSKLQNFPAKKSIFIQLFGFQCLCFTIELFITKFQIFYIYIIIKYTYITIMCTFWSAIKIIALFFASLLFAVCDSL